MFEYDNTLILFGRSPFIKKIAKHIPELCNKYHTMGCNYFVNSFPMVEYVVFYDDLIPNVQPHNTVITNIQYFEDENFKSYNLLHDHKKTDLYIINKESDFYSINPHMLNFCIHTPSMALNWAYLKGFKNVIIAGIDLTLKNNAHFDKNITPDRDGHDFNIKAITKARRHLEEITPKYLNVYQMNLNSDINIPKIGIKKLLCNAVLKKS